MSEPRFKNAKVGDKVWSREYGCGRIIDTDHVSSDNTQYYPIQVAHPEHPTDPQIYTLEGYYWKDKRDFRSDYHAGYTLHWDTERPAPDYEAEFKAHLIEKFND